MFVKHSQKSDLVVSVLLGQQISLWCGHGTEDVIAPVTGSTGGFSTALVHPDAV